MSATRNARRKFAPTAASFAAMALLSACVTINVYFPAAEAKEAAKEFVEKVIGDELPNGAKPEEAKPEQKTPDGGGMASLLQRIDPLSLVGIGTRACAGATGHHDQDAGDPGDPVAHGRAFRFHAAQGAFRPRRARLQQGRPGRCCAIRARSS